MNWQLCIKYRDGSTAGRFFPRRKDAIARASIALDVEQVSSITIEKVHA